MFYSCLLFLALVCRCYSFFCFNDECRGTIITTPVGDINGFVKQIRLDSRLVNVKKFQGIPYAEPPVEDRRFAKPVPRGKFTSTFDATKPAPSCFQINAYSPVPVSNYTFTEDCLVLNVIAPEICNEKTLKPVMVWIHGGGFVTGTSSYYDVDYFSAVGDVIVVTINYRLAQLGFFTTGDANAPGNLGLWDQHLAIRWVHDNIKAFGGDPSNVTVFGESSGGYSVVAQMVYPGNKGLFQRAIAQSGSAVELLGFPPLITVVNSSRDFAEHMKCSQPLAVDLMKCLRFKSSQEINATINAPTGTFTRPIIDNDFFLDDPRRIINGSSTAKDATETFKSIDLLIGFNNRDGVLDVPMMLHLLNQTDIDTLTVSRQSFETLVVPHYLQFVVPPPLPAALIQTAVLVFTDWSDPNDDFKRLNKVAEISTSVYFGVASVETANGHVASSNSSTYMYKFSVRGLPKRILQVPSSIDGPEVANHGDELSFLFRGQDSYDVELMAKQMNLSILDLAVLLRVSRELITMWTNFAKTGNPNRPVDVTMYTNTIWPQYGSEENFLEFFPEKTLVKQRITPIAVEFFSKVLPSLMSATSTSCPPLPTTDNQKNDDGGEK